MRFTAHAIERMQHRNFPQSVVEAIVSYGVANFVKGAVSVMLDNQAIGLVAETDKYLAIKLERYRGHMPLSVIKDKSSLWLVALVVLRNKSKKSGV